MLRGARPVTVFVVEDSPVMLDRVTMLLEELPGVGVVGSAARAGVAISEIVRLQPDLAIVDLRLEEGSGHDVVRAIRTWAPATRAIVMSSYAEAAHRAAAADEGVVAFLDKSDAFDELPRVIRSVTAREGAGT